MKTLLLDTKGDEYINICSDIVKKSGIVALPTETVYGLCANALDESAVKKIFKAKGRPQDNPLIVHISGLKDVEKYAKNIPESAYLLFEKFWPGPLTVILKKRDIISDLITANHDTVALRLPNNRVMQNIIKKSGVPLAAPSANLSGRPSPTEFSHVVEDMNGKIDAIVDGGKCDIGVESTVISLIDDPIILRPGFITIEEIEKFLPTVKLYDKVFSEINEKEKVLSPGMKYRHYAPKSPLICVIGEDNKAANYINSNLEINTFCIVFDNESHLYKTKNIITYGIKQMPNTLLKNLYSALRKADSYNAEKIYIHCPEMDKEFNALYNRIILASSHNVIYLGNK
ncbi:MAG: threonylcarbamoyl-AMP synthase [Clostridiales bacterium GWF2_36_10]|nr:MAG: threonylcarbamoyl-AMP synthase [Clostridiales bacterium GWF2_36_10]